MSFDCEGWRKKVVSKPVLHEQCFCLLRRLADERGTFIIVENSRVHGLYSLI
jgi:hypothetical protein